MFLLYERAFLRATEAGHGMLAVGRPWVQFEGWVLKESGALTDDDCRALIESGSRRPASRAEIVQDAADRTRRSASAGWGSPVCGPWRWAAWPRRRR